MKIAILGGGQLGRMFLQQALNYPYPVAVLDPDGQAPCAGISETFIQGDFQHRDSVLDFVAQVQADAVGIEIEHVSPEALEILAEKGKRVIPTPQVLRIIQDKGRQKQFYQQHHLPTAPFYLADNKADICVERLPLPFVQKLRTGGYDGKGVQIIRSQADLEKLWDAPSVIEALCPVAREIAVVVATDGQGRHTVYPIIEMVFNPTLNLVDYVQMPALLGNQTRQKAENIALQLVSALDSAGIFAVEMFISTAGEIWINETAPRVHNSAHLTIEACNHSQFEQMWRLLAGMPPVKIRQYRPAAMVNLIGAEGCFGRPILAGLEQLLHDEDIYIHWYGKAETRPGRKMGHVTVLGEDLAALPEKIALIKQTLKVISDE